MKMETIETSNGLRLSMREWCVVAVILSVACWILPALVTASWPRDYRIPENRWDDYWYYQKQVEQAAKQYDVMVLGDSVMWGGAVQQQESMAELLPDAANVALGGLHPAAMEGLVWYYGDGFKGKHVLLYFNPLWLSTPRADLTGDKEVPIHHVRLLPQWRPAIPSYRAHFEEKASIVFERSVTLRGLSEHFRINSFGGESFGRWVVHHPNACPVSALTVQDDKDSWDAATIMKTGDDVTQNNWPWVALADSFQWRRFIKTIDLLKRKNAQVFVLIGRLNRQVMTEESLARYDRLLEQVVSELSKRNHPLMVVPMLPEAEYVDASHPTAEGYARWAEHLRENETFRRWSGIE